MGYFKIIDKKEIHRMHRKASRDEQIESGNKNHGHVIHKSKKDFTRKKQPAYKYLSEEDDF